MKILIYGASLQAQQLRFYVESENRGTVAAFVVDREYKERKFGEEATLDGLSIISFEDACRMYPRETPIAVSVVDYGHMMQDRARIFALCRAAGFELFTFISNRACVYATAIGAGTIIYPNCTVSYGVELGEGAFLEVGVTIAHHTKVGRYNFFAPASTVCGAVSIGNYNFFGASCTILNGGQIGNKVLVGAGAVVGNAEDRTVYLPARTARWHGTSDEMKLR